MLLAIDTATRYAGVALLHQGRVVRSLSWHAQHNHSKELLPAIQAVLETAEASVSDLDGLALSGGPGSFSALRVGFSVAKALALVWGVPVTAVGTLEAEGLPYRVSGVPTVAILDAGRGEVAWSSFDGQDPEGAPPPHLGPVEELAVSLRPGAVLCGEGLEAHGEALAQAVAEGVHLALPYLPGLRAISLAYLGQQRLARGQTDDPGTLEPLYLRRPSVGPPRR